MPHVLQASHVEDYSVLAHALDLQLFRILELLQKLQVVLKKFVLTPLRRDNDLLGLKVNKERVQFGAKIKQMHTSR